MTSTKNKSAGSLQGKMSLELSVKDLKALLDDNSIDLSMRQLVTIPVKALVSSYFYKDFSAVIFGAILL